ncbi:MAG TPA: hypothetical protein DEB18_00830, partial [Leeuwenhoekiella sp.]|nr:hypothetical protein [Leeuwenhoekiella sp.]
KTAKNNFAAPRFLLKAAKVALALDKKDKAASLLKQIEEDYSTSAEASEVPLLLGVAGAE